jgi:NADH dehydrogenase
METPREEFYEAAKPSPAAVAAKADGDKSKSGEKANAS